LAARCSLSCVASAWDCGSGLLRAESGRIGAKGDEIFPSWHPFGHFPR